MQNKIILTTALKGGVGKSCLCANFATFFVEQGQPVIVLDADIQQSISRHRKRDLDSHPSAKIPWQVHFLNPTDLDGVREMMKRIKRLPCIVLIDCPGNIQDPALQIIYSAADVAIIPYELNSDSVDATKIFAEVFKKNFSAKIFFIPNKISAVFEKRGEVRKAREDAVEALSRKLGEITPDIPLTTHLNGYSTLELFNFEKRKALKYAFGPIYKYVTC
jgi:chromosome partitioning protein